MIVIAAMTMTRAAITTTTATAPLEPPPPPPTNPNTWIYPRAFIRPTLLRTFDESLSIPVRRSSDSDSLDRPPQRGTHSFETMQAWLDQTTFRFRLDLNGYVVMCGRPGTLCGRISPQAKRARISLTRFNRSSHHPAVSKWWLVASLVLTQSLSGYECFRTAPERASCTEEIKVTG
jgi:hypothetical protein